MEGDCNNSLHEHEEAYREDERNDEEAGLLMKNRTSSDTGSNPVISVNVKNQRKLLRSNFLRNVKSMKRPEFILIVIALLLTLGWFEFVCIVKHDHEAMKLLAIQQQTNNSNHKNTISFIDIHKKNSKSTIDSPEENQSNTSATWGAHELIKPLKDEKQYKFLQLENEMKVLLVSDKKSTSSLVALDVRVGSWREHIPGLSHFLEHMKFQTVNEEGNPCELDDFLTNHQGVSNAYTQNLNTNYYFYVEPSGLSEALGIFRQMFSSHSYSKDSVLREVNAVNSEYVNQLTNDDWKQQNLLTTISKENHPNRNFTCGNNESLLDKKFDILKELETYDKDHYSSHLMSLVVLSDQSIEELEKIVQDAKFNVVPRIQFNPKFTGFPLPYGKESIGRVYKIKASNSDFKQLSLAFQIPCSKFNNRNDIAAYFSDLLENNSEGSLTNYYISQGFSSKVTFEEISKTEDFIVFSLTVNLSEKGYQNIDEVISGYFSFVRQFQEHFDESNFKQKGVFQDILFKYDPNDDFDIEKISGWSYYINYSDKPENLFIQEKYQDFNKSDLKNFCKYLGDPLKTIVMIKSTSFEEIENSRFAQGLDNEFDVRVDLYNLDYSVIHVITEEDSEYLQSQDIQFTVSLDLSLAPNSTTIQFFDPHLENSQTIQKLVQIDGKILKQSVQPIAFQVSSKEYARDPFGKLDSLSWEKFAFNEENWSERLKESSGDNQYMPLLIAEKEGLKSFFMLDAGQDSILSDCRIRLSNKNQGFASKNDMAFREVFLFAQKQFIESKYASAISAKYIFKLAQSVQDLQISFSGWRENYEDVQDQMLSSLKENIPSDEEWQQAANSVLISAQETLSEQNMLKKLSKNTVIEIIDPQSFTLQQKVEFVQEVASISQDEVKQKASKIFERTDLNLFFSGNMSPEEAISSTNQINSLFGQAEINEKDAKDSVDRLYKIVDFTGKSLVYQQLNPAADDTNSAILNLYQIGERSIDGLIYTNMLADKMDRFFYDYLRTRQGLGYIAGASTQTIGCVEHIAVFLQGNKKQPNEIDELIEKGFVEFHEQIKEDLKEEEFAEILGSLRANYENLPSSYDDKVDVMKKQIDRETYDFDLRLYVLHAIDHKITLKGFQDFFERNFYENGSKFSFQIFSQATEYDLDARVTTGNFALNLQNQDSAVVSKREDLVELNEDKYFQCSRVY